MSLPPFARRIDQLRHLRDRIEAEIAEEERRLARVEQARRDTFGEFDRPRSPAPTGRPPASEVRDWARAAGIEVGSHGRISADVYEAYALAHTVNPA